MGFKAYEKQNYYLAIKYLESALEKNPMPELQYDDSPARPMDYVPYYLLGRAYEEIGNTDKAKYYFIISDSIGLSKQSQFCKNLGLINLGKGDNESSLISNREFKIRKKYAIIIGISNYKDLPDNKTKDEALVDLKYAHRDALIFKEFLENTVKCGPNWEIIELIEQKATTSKVEDELTKIFTYSNRDDLIYVFFSGHARCHSDRPQDIFLLTYDFKKNHKRSGLEYNYLQRLMKEANSEHIIAFIDACRSGTIGWGSGVKSEKDGGRPRHDHLLNALKKIPKNRIIFSSGRGEQRSYEDDELKQGIFTYFLLEGLKGAAPDENLNGRVDIIELGNYVTKKVKAYTTKLKKKGKIKSIQVPFVGESEGTLAKDFPVALREK